MGLFGCLTELGAKWAELMQKFVPRSCVGIFRYECTRSTPLDPKLINLVCFVLFGCIWDRSVDLRNSVQNWPTSAKVRARSRIGIFCNERSRSTQLDPKLTFWCVSYYLGVFGTVWLPYQTQTGRTSAKVCATKSRRNFRNECTRSTPLDPKLIY